jgi:hypothetical protein
MHTDEGHRPEMKVEYECTCNECETVSIMNTSASAPSSGASPAEWLLTAAGKRVSVSRAHQLPRRRPVRRHPGIYYRPRRDGKVGPPYEIRYLDSSGKHRWEVVHGNLEAAEARRAELRLRRRRGERTEPNRQTFEQYASEWLERQTLRPRTLELYSWALDKHLIPYFGRRRLDQIQAEDVALFVAQMRRKPYKGWTITSALRPLSIILAQAARKGRIPVNPMSQLERGERPRHDDQRPKQFSASRRCARSSRARTASRHAACSSCCSRAVCESGRRSASPSPISSLTRAWSGSSTSSAATELARD